MFQNLVRRISGSILPRSDRPWSEDATSNAPTIGRKRRLSTPGEDDEGESIAKRTKGEDGAPARDESSSQHVPEVKETEEVKGVTQGVNEVELEDGKPETVPLPASPPPDTRNAEEAKEDAAVVSPTKSPKSKKAAVVEGANVSPTAKAAPEPIAADAPANPDSVAAKAPRKTRKLPSKAARPSSKAAKKIDKPVEPKGKTLEEVVDSKQDSGSA